MWLIAEYQPAALFSLKLSLATSTGAKTLLVPTPFAVRTALLDVAIRHHGLATGKEIFGWLKELRIALSPPERVVVTNMFVKVQKPRRSDKGGDNDDAEAGASAMQRTIAFREYAYLEGRLGLAFEGDEVPLAELDDLLHQVNYFGKRGSFFQLRERPYHQEMLPGGYSLLDTLGGGQTDRQVPSAFPLGLVQIMDDWGPDLTFEKINVHTINRITLGEDRVLRHVILPYRLVHSSKSYSYFERMD
jgi:hypothetical protein